MEAEHTGLSVLKFTDYRVYLNEFHQGRKRTRTGWSYSVWTKKLGLRSPSALLMILKGQRNPSELLVRNLNQYFQHPPREAEYFSDLVKLEKQKKDPRLSVLLMEKLASQQGEGSFRQVNLEMFSALSNWYYYAIRKMIGMNGFQESPGWISRKLRHRVSPTQVAQALTTLVRLGLVDRNEAGQLYATEQHVETVPQMASEAIRRFHEQTLDNVRSSLTSIAPADREVIATCFPMRLASLPMAKERLTQMLNSFCNELEDNQGEVLFGFQLSLIPLTRKESAGDAPERSSLQD